MSSLVGLDVHLTKKRKTKPGSKTPSMETKRAHTGPKKDILSTFSKLLAWSALGITEELKAHEAMQSDQLVSAECLAAQRLAHERELRHADHQLAIQQAAQTAEQHSQLVQLMMNQQTAMMGLLERVLPLASHAPAPAPSTANLPPSYFADLNFTPNGVEYTASQSSTSIFDPFGGTSGTGLSGSGGGSGGGGGMSL
jgi:hypothetical protein